MSVSSDSSDELRSFRRKPVRTSIEVGAVKYVAGLDLGLRDEEQALELPHGFSRNTGRRKAGMP